MTNTTALITGASGGIGYELARLFARDGVDLVIVARRREKLEEVAAGLRKEFGIAVKPVALDLSETTAPQSLFDELQTERIVVDVLVNNAGYGMAGEFGAIPLAESIGQVQLNITALTALTKLFLVPMLERRSGRILNVASTAGFQPGPLMAVYYATKGYVISFSEAIANEVKDRGVTVTCLCPGVTDTDFQQRAGTGTSGLFRILRPMDAATVARIGYRALMSGKVLVITGFMNKVLAQTVRFSPRAMVTAISRKLLERPR